MPSPSVRPLRQATLAHEVCTSGVGVHSGARTRVRLGPAPAGSGIVFVREDLGAVRIPARWDRVVDTRLCTVLREGAAEVSTVEHLMAALAASGIDNAEVGIDGPEVPIMDGSAAPWMSLLARAGAAAQAAPRRVLRVLRPVRVHEGDKWAVLLPSPEARFSVEIDFSDALIGRQRADHVLDTDAFRREIAPARTFAFAREVAQMQAQGRARGGSLDNAVLVDGDRVLNAGGLRFPDEFARHKLLDCVGDLYLAGAPMLARMVASRPGHALNIALLRALFAEGDAWAFEPAARAGDDPLAVALGRAA